MSISEEFPLVEENHTPQETNQPMTPPLEKPEALDESRPPEIRLPAEDSRRQSLRWGLQILILLLVVLAAWAGWSFILNKPGVMLEIPQQNALAAPLSENQTPTPAPVNLPVFTTGVPAFQAGIPRLAVLHTSIPTRPRVEVVTYTVQQGDTIFGIAERFGLKPETIFWGNRETLGDNPHNLRAGQDLNILPVDGTYHKWSAGESFRKVAEFYGVDPQVIVDWPGNPLDPYAFNIDEPDIEPGTYLIIPGGKREFIDWGPPRIPRNNPAVARTYGPGFCGTITDGAVGGGAFIWPTTATYLSGYDYSPASNHYGIDIAGSLGNPVYASDAGVVVYSGWSNYGYGYLIVLDHGNGWQTLYAHLSAINVICGQSVFQGTAIGAIGSTGNSSGPHLHFEMMYGTAKVNPWNYVSP